ncbi:MAG: flagellar biosynthetic protein FliO, partial [Nitrospinota bacterium]
MLALIFFAAAGAKKFLSKNESLFGNNQFIRVLSSVPIAVKKQVLLVDVAGEVLVLGVSNENITMLT